MSANENPPKLKAFDRYGHRIEQVEFHPAWHESMRIAKENGMFSFLGLSVEQAQGLRKERGLYMLDSSRINVAALNDRNMDIVVDAVASVL